MELTYSKTIGIKKTIQERQYEPIIFEASLTVSGSNMVQIDEELNKFKKEKLVELDKWIQEHPRQ